VELKGAREQIGRCRFEGNGRLNGGGALIYKRWNFRERRDRACRTRNDRTAEKGGKERRTGRKRRCIPVGMSSCTKERAKERERERERKWERESYLSNSVRLHRPFSVGRFTYDICLRPSSGERITRSPREIALILVRSWESRNFIGMCFSRFRR